MKLVSFSLEQGSKYYGKIDADRFFIGRRVNGERYGGGNGLMNIVGNPGQRYDREVYRSKYGFWADFIHPTATAEGALFHTLNTYDRARFTFSFLQFAAHVPEGDFVVYLRSLLALPLAVEYFPDLRLVDGHVCRLTDEAMLPLESSISTAPLLDYLNPTAAQVEDTEVIQAAKLIHWVQNDPRHMEVQVQVGIDHFKTKMARYAVQYELDGASDEVCLVVADIRHQGRAKSAEIRAALARSDQLASLLRIGDPEYRSRLSALKREMNRLREEDRLGKRRYDLAKREFV
jgi:hypothetical protein